MRDLSEKILEKDEKKFDFKRKFKNGEITIARGTIVTRKTEGIVKKVKRGIANLDTYFPENVEVSEITPKTLILYIKTEKDNIYVGFPIDEKIKLKVEKYLSNEKAILNQKIKLIRINRCIERNGFHKYNTYRLKIETGSLKGKTFVSRFEQ